jgi:hypothetical protein
MCQRIELDQLYQKMPVFNEMLDPRHQYEVVSLVCFYLNFLTLSNPQLRVAVGLLFHVTFLPIIDR